MRTRALDLDGPAGRLEAVLMTPAGRKRAGAVLCHAHPLHGGTMHFKLLFRAAKILQREGFSVLRFHFRGIGRSEGSYDHGRGEADDARTAVEALARETEGPILLGGFSFGAAVALRVGSGDERVSAMFLMGLPVGSVEGIRAENPAGKPTLFIQGERDEFGGEEAIRDFVRRFAEPKDLVVVPGADHFFTGKEAALEGAIAEWIRRRPEQPT